MNAPAGAAISLVSPAISCRGVVKSFGSGDVLIRVIHDVDLNVFAGQMTLLIGPSGCGKTTMISMIAGILTADQGEIDVFGTVVTKLKGDRLVKFRRENIGFIFQQFNLLPALTATENAAIPLIVQGVNESRANSKARDLLARLGLEKHLAKYPTQLSGGQQQRVAIARALVHEPRFIVCDEPTASLDAASGRAAMDLLKAAAVKPDRAVIVVTHDHRVFSFADRIISMSDGRVERTIDDPSQMDAN
ncbi:MAG: ABC transporter ATP-binding protein [Hyphomicrobium aestuarii]|nr:ABC transporter ATP-binding protein [Hyphomicrobium aestuarii]